MRSSAGSSTRSPGRKGSRSAGSSPRTRSGPFPDAASWPGTYEGREAIFRFLAKLPTETDGTYGSELIDVLASDDRAAALYRARGTRHGRTLELDQVLLFRIEDGLVRHVLALPSDPDAFEAFWA